MFGSIVGTVGDIDGDGRSDVAIGDPHGDRDCASGGLWILSSKDDRELLVLHSLPHSGSTAGVLEMRGIAWNVYQVGDCNSDGTPDILIAVDQQSSGSLHVVSGRDGTGLWTREMPTRIREGVTSLCVAPPANEDGPVRIAVLEGRGDMTALTATVVSAADGRELDRFQIQNEHRCRHAALAIWGPMGPDANAGWAVLLEPRSDDWPTMDLAASARRTILRTYSADARRTQWSRELGDLYGSWGTELVVLGDVDTDGHPDLAASFAQGVEVVSGRTGRSLRRFDSVRDGWAEGLGCALVAPGDLDGDGTADIVMGQYDTCVYLGAVIAKSGRDGHEIWRQQGDETDDQHHLGYRIAVLGDVDGDHVSDLLAGTLHGRAGKPGLAVLISGARGRILGRYRRDGAQVKVTRTP